MSLCRSALTRGFLVVAMSSTAVPRLSPAQVSVTPIHLVGHEDHELLDRVQDVIDDWDSRKLVNPVFSTVEVQHADGTLAKRKILKRSDLDEFIADVEAAEALGKAFFWETQAGSDFRRLEDGRYVGTACASCHFRNGADPRGRHTTRIPYVVWDQYELHPDHNDPVFPLGESQLAYDVVRTATSDYQFDKELYGNLSFIVGSAGLPPALFDRLNEIPASATEPPPGWQSEVTALRLLGPPAARLWKRLPEWSMFVEDQDDLKHHFRQITTRNSPSVFNSGFADRLFHDGRAESTFNGFSIFGDRDARPVLWRGVPLVDADGRPVRDADGHPVFGRPVQVDVAITNAALASQAVGPIVNDVEMSYTGRSFPNLACKLLPARVLRYQSIADDDSVLGRWKQAGMIGVDGTLTYEALIRQAFRREWWDSGLEPDPENPGRFTEPQRANDVPLMMMGEADEDRRARGSIMHANFSLYWGLSILLYESSLVSNESPFDAMMVGNPRPVNERWNQVKGDFGTIRLDRARINGAERPVHENGASVFQHGFRVFLNRNCIECHSGPLFSELYERLPEVEKFPIHELVSHTLLPNSRADALADRRTLFHSAKLTAASMALQTDAGLTAKEADLWAQDLDLLREQAQGSFRELQSLVKNRLGSLNPLPSNLNGLATQVAQTLWEFEKKLPENLGDREFFTEDDRIALAELLTEPVLVEKMVIRPDQVLRRPILPIAGPLAKEDYAFYDTAFYAIAVSPPRYDRGIGARKSVMPPDDAPETQLEELRRFALAEDDAPQNAKALYQSRATLRRTQVEAKAARSGDQQLQKLPDSAVELQTLQQEITPVPQLDSLAEVRQANDGSPGQAYEFKRQWRSVDEFRLEFVDGETRSCHEGPSYDPDAQEKTADRPDKTWDRIDVPDFIRRSLLVFFSRARTLVSDEERWGYRKPFLHDNELAFFGAFKTPSLRNVELTAPYMHNGRLQSLEELIDFYDEGGFFAIDEMTNPDKHPEIIPLDMTEHDKKALRFFLLCLTDERVRLEQAPFDHPSLNVVHGYDELLTERILEVSQVGTKGWTKPDGIPDVAKIPSPFPVQ